MPSHSQDQPRLDKFSSAAEIEKVLAKNRQKMAALSEAFRQLGRSTGSTHLARRPVEERRRDQEVLGKLMEGLPEQERLPPEQHSVASKIVEQELPPKLPKTSQPSTHVESDEKDLQRAVDIGLLERALNEFDVPGIGFKQWLNELLPNNGHSKERLEVSGDEFLESISSIFRRASLKRPDWQDLAWLQSQFPHFSLSANVSLSAREVVAIGKLCFESALAKLLEEVGQDCFPPPVRYPITTKTTVPAIFFAGSMFECILFHRCGLIASFGPSNAAGIPKNHRDWHTIWVGCGVGSQHSKKGANGITLSGQQHRLPFWICKLWLRLHWLVVSTWTGPHSHAGPSTTAKLITKPDYCATSTYESAAVETSIYC